MKIKEQSASPKSPIMLGAEIGRGGYGTVYVKADDPGLCVKVSNKKSAKESCRKWSNEHKKIRGVISAIGEELKKMKMVRVITPVAFRESSEECYMVLPRIYRPEGRDYTAKPTIQAQLGLVSGSMIHKGRGEFLGLKECAAIVGDRGDLERACYELGAVMGLIHFRGKNDAYDVEVYLGKEAGSKKCRFYIADFDLTEEIKELDDPVTLERMTWSIDAVPYFPTTHSDEALFELFRKGYKEIADGCGVDESVVEAVFENYG